jgi:hypothetical protein
MTDLYKEKIKEIRQKRLLMEIFNDKNQYDDKLKVYERYEQNINYLLTLFKPENHDSKDERTES